VRELAAWLSGGGDAARFPYDAVVAAYQRTGKHFVAPDLLGLLDKARAAATGDPLLRDFLDVALDKHDGRYDYRSYLALPLLRPPATGRRRHHDRLLVRLVADAMAFERAAPPDLLPLQRPEPAVVGKRLRLGARAAAPALARLGRPDDVPTPDERRALRLSMLPVYVVHDEYLFIRVLQAYEVTFTALADELRSAIGALDAGNGPTAAAHLAHARDVLAGAAPLFSLMATVQRESFRTFRAYTEGASAIQSRSYKLVEALCRTPDGSRLSSVAFGSVPEVRDRVLAGERSVEAAFRASRLPEADRRLVGERMAEFAAAVLQWRHTHHRIAVRMLGTRPGTGYTEGTPYLAATRSIPVFTDPGGDPT